MEVSVSEQVEDLDLPIKRNQAFVIQYFSKTRDKFCHHLLGEGKQDLRWQLLTEVQLLAHPQLHHSLLSPIRLLTRTLICSCCCL